MAGLLNSRDSEMKTQKEKTSDEVSNRLTKAIDAYAEGQRDE